MIPDVHLRMKKIGCVLRPHKPLLEIFVSSTCDLLEVTIFRVVLLLWIKSSCDVRSDIVWKPKHMVLLHVKSVSKTRISFKQLVLELVLRFLFCLIKGYLSYSVIISTL